MTKNLPSGESPWHEAGTNNENLGHQATIILSFRGSRNPVKEVRMKLLLPIAFSGEWPIHDYYPSSFFQVTTYPLNISGKNGVSSPCFQLQHLSDTKLIYYSNVTIIY